MRLQILRRSLENKQREYSYQKERKDLATKRSTFRKQLNRTIKSELKNHIDAIQTIHRAATRIQRVYRGYRVRSQTDRLFVSKQYEAYESEVLSLTTQSNFCRIALGEAVKPAVQLISDHYIRYKFKIKLSKLKQFYHQFLETQKEKRLSNLKSAICTFAIKQRIRLAKFEIYKAKRLKVIRVNLAILTIKYVWKRKNLTTRVIKDRYVKIKRRRAALALKERLMRDEARQEDSKNEVSTNSISRQEYSRNPISRQEHSRNPISRQEYSRNSISRQENSRNKNIQKEQFEESEYVNSDSDDSILRLELTEEDYNAYIAKKKEQKRIRKMKIENGKIAYGIKAQKPKFRMPIYQEKLLMEDSYHDFNPSQSMLGSSKSKRADRQKTRNTMISEGKMVHSRRASDLPPLIAIDTPDIYTENKRKTPNPSELNSAHFLLQTVSFHNKVDFGHEKRLKKKIKLRHYRYQHTLKNTLSNNSKQQEKRKHSEDLRPWKTPYYMKFSYTPSIDNMWYTPVPWARNQRKPSRTSSADVQIPLVSYDNNV